jgi:hypothetical protein
VEAEGVIRNELYCVGAAPCDDLRHLAAPCFRIPYT